MVMKLTSHIRVVVKGVPLKLISDYDHGGKKQSRILQISMTSKLVEQLTKAVNSELVALIFRIGLATFFNQPV